MFKYKMHYTREYEDGSSDHGSQEFIEKDTVMRATVFAEGRRYNGKGKPFIARNVFWKKIKEID